MNFNLTFKQIISHADDLKHAGVRVRGLQKRMLEHEWKDKNIASHHSYYIVLYVFVTLMRLYNEFCLILYIRSKRHRRRWWAH
jgi:hypothetical protein